VQLILQILEALRLKLLLLLNEFRLMLHVRNLGLVLMLQEHSLHVQHEALLGCGSCAKCG